MRIAVCDDSHEDALHIKNLLRGQEVFLYTSSESLLKDIENNSAAYDLYLLDIYMQEPLNGIELARKLRSQNEEAALCFISTSDAFYREAYDLYAVQYLLKPVQEKDLKKLLDKVSGNLMRDKEQSLCFKWRGKTCAVPYRKILYISSREHTLSVYCKDGTVREFKGRLAETAMQVRSDMFCRCHQSFLVNLYQVDSLSGNELVIAGQRIPVSRRYYGEVKHRYQEILFEEVE